MHQDLNFNLSLPAFSINTNLIYFPVNHQESVEVGGSGDEQPPEEAAVVCRFTFTH